MISEHLNEEYLSFLCESKNICLLSYLMRAAAEKLICPVFSFLPFGLTPENWILEHRGGQKVKRTAVLERSDYSGLEHFH